jgi:cysteine-rich repeat protein
VCDTSDQLVRHLAATTLNLSANLIAVATPLAGEDFATVGEAWAEAVAVLTGASDADAEAVKDVLDRINNQVNTTLDDACAVDEPVCGDGEVEGDEACDDGNTADGDGCSATCEIGPAPACGDGNVDFDEECDDGNTTDGDGCSASCACEPGFECEE